MKLSKYGALVLTVLILACTSGAFAAEGTCSDGSCKGPFPWENPDAGLKPGTPGSSSQIGSTGKIETVVDKTGGSKDEGKVVSNTGTDKQQGFVNGVLDNVADQIKTTGAGSGWAWTWQKQWRVDADGNPYEVKEDWQRGEIGVKRTPEDNPAPATPAAPAKPATPAKTSTTPAPATPASPGKAASTPAKPSVGKVATPAKGSKTPAKPTADSPDAPATASTGKPDAPAKAAAPEEKPGVEIAPKKEPEESLIQLAVQNPVTFKENPFKAAVRPEVPDGPISGIVDRLPEPVPEDTRVRIGLELSPNIAPDDVKLVVIDQDGAGDPIIGAPPNYRHIFRIPNEKDYKALVYYKGPSDTREREVINVTIPVHKLGFDSVSIDSQQHRSDNTAGLTSGGELANLSSPGGNSGGSSVMYSSGNSSNISASEMAGGAPVDLSDLYVDPSSPPELSAGSGDSGASSRYADASGETTDDAAIAANDGSLAVGGNAEGANEGSLRLASAVGGQGNSDLPSQGGTAGRLSAPGDPEAVTEPETAVGRRGRSRRGSSTVGGGGSSSGSSSTFASAAGRSGSGGSSSGSGSSLTRASTSETSGGNYYSSTQPQDYSADYIPDANQVHDVNSAQNTVNSSEVANPDEKFILSLSLRDPASKIVQSFNFTDNPAPTTSEIDRNTKLLFSMNFAEEVVRDSVTVILSDGKAQQQHSLASLGGDAFDHLFPEQTSNAYIWIYGDTKTGRFSFKVSIPVK